MKAAALQMVSGTDVASNLAHARALIERAAAQGAELVLLPEFFCLMGRRDGDKLLAREAFGHGPIQSFLRRAAMDLGIWLVGGTVPLCAPDPRLMFNSCLVYSPQGDCVARYDKVHLFAFDNGQERYDESRVLQAGSDTVSFELPSRDGYSWRVGLSICYDLRFPELYRRLGADLLLVPSAFTHTTGRAHWELLLRARAVENLAYVLASAQGGEHENGRRTWGYSMAVDPWGEIQAWRAQGEGEVLADLHMTRLRECRQQLPALTHRVW